MPGPVFMHGESVDLHVIEEEDLPFLQETINHPDVWLTLGRASPVTEQDEATFYEQVVHGDAEEHLLICSAAEPIGIIGVHDIDATWGVGEIGYFLTPAAQGNGFATEAVEVFTHYAFDERRLEKLFANVLANNIPSQRVLEKNGFEQEGQLRQHAFRNGQREDVYVYGKVAPRLAEST